MQRIAPLSRRSQSRSERRMIKAERGEKHRCLACNTAFFDLNRAPIVCPKCDEIFIVVELAHSAPRRVGGSPNGSRWRSPPLEAQAQELGAEEKERDEETELPDADEEAAPESGDDEIPEVGDEIPEIEDESADADIIREVL
jgi:uncharacterized protein (TIGR02300 family)